MTEIRQNSCCRRAIARAHLCDHVPTLADIAWLLGISPRWAGELRKKGVLPEGAPLPVLVKRMARYKPEAKSAARRALLAKRKVPQPKNG